MRAIAPASFYCKERKHVFPGQVPIEKREPFFNDRHKHGYGLGYESAICVHKIIVRRNARFNCVVVFVRILKLNGILLQVEKKYTLKQLNKQA